MGAPDGLQLPEQVQREVEELMVLLSRTCTVGGLKLQRQWTRGQAGSRLSTRWYRLGMVGDGSAMAGREELAEGRGAEGEDDEGGSLAGGHHWPAAD